jgi:t-SNARE complex subunit (syntaxin)
MTNLAPNDEAARARKGRNIALGLGLIAFVILIFVVTVVRLGGSVAHRAF